MTEYAKLRFERRRPPEDSQPKGVRISRQKRKAPMKRVSKKRAALMRVVGPERQARKEEVGECMICRQSFAPEELDGDEIARGPAREKCLSEPTLTLYSCRKCHTISQDWPIPKRIAVIIRWTIDQTCALYCELKGYAPTAVVADEVIDYLIFKNKGKKKRRKNGNQIANS